MGQYYNVVLQNKQGEYDVFDRSVDGEYQMAKLMEHSWWENPFVSSINKLLFKNSMKVAWVGDYSNDCTDEYDIENIYELAWGDESKAHTIKNDQLPLDGLYLVNHSDKTYIDCTKYKEENIDDDGWVIAPIPLLTCVGNGLGGGDYTDEYNDFVGLWYMSEISVEENAPDEYTEVLPHFDTRY